VKIYKGIENGKPYLAIRIGDACFGIGRAPQWMRDEALRSRKNFGV
jgi:hypothetical protein